MAASSNVARSELRREKRWMAAIVLLLVFAFCLVFKPLRLAPTDQFVDVYFTYRYEQQIGPGERPKEQLRAAFKERLRDTDIAPDARMTFPTTTEIKIRVPLENEGDCSKTDTDMQKILDEVVGDKYGKRQGSEVDTSNFPDKPLAQVGRFGFYRPMLHLRLGLDLQGGVHLVLQARTQNVRLDYKLAPTAADLTAALDALDKADAKKPAEAPKPEAGAKPEAEAKPATEAKPAEAPKPEESAEPAPQTPAGSGGGKPEAPLGMPDANVGKTAPQGGQPIRMAQADDLPFGADEPPTDEGGEPEQLEETVVDPEEAKLLANEELRLRVQDRISALATALRSARPDILSDLHGEVIASNVVVFRTSVDAKTSDEAKRRMQAQQDVVLAELIKAFPKAVALGEPEQLELPNNPVQLVKDVVERRVDRLGVSEAAVRTQGTDRVVVELPGVRDPDEAVQLLGTTAQLEFRKVPPRYEPRPEDYGGREETVFYLKGGSEQVPAEIVYYEAPEFKGDKNVLTGGDLVPESASVSFDNQGKPVVLLSVKRGPSKRFDSFAADNYKEFLAIYLDRHVISAPEMRARRFGGQVQISGGFESVEEASNLKMLLNAGALPVPVDVVEQRSVSATLGADAVRQSCRAGAVGLALVFCVMLLYKGAGLLADIALLGYCLLTFAVLVMFDATLTLPGILGLILSVGMAVDANVIIFERLKEELRESQTRPLSACIRNSYERAMAAIVDGNATTLIIAAILYVLGTGPIRGFAVTLSIGILCSMFSALVVTRRLQNLFAATELGSNRRCYRS